MGPEFEPQRGCSRRHQVMVVSFFYANKNLWTQTVTVQSISIRPMKYRRFAFLLFSWSFEDIDSLYFYDLWKLYSAGCALTTEKGLLHVFCRWRRMNISLLNAVLPHDFLRTTNFFAPGYVKFYITWVMTSLRLCKVTFQKPAKSCKLAKALYIIMCLISIVTIPWLLK